MSNILPDVSILMPVYNEALYLQECLNSIIAQDELNWELIAVDDFSTDNSWTILTQYASQDHRIKCLKNHQKGIIPALRLAFEISIGDMITRMDADDIMPKEKISSLKSLLHKRGQSHVATGLVKYFSEKEIQGGYQSYEKWLNDLSLSETNYSEIYKECVIPSPCWMIYRSDLIKCGSFSSDIYPEDYDLCFRLRNAGIKIATVKEIMHYWRDHESRISRNGENYADNKFLDLKMYHFILNDHKKDKQLVLWGAGKKGKLIAQELNQKNIPFHWVCNNASKIGHNIYDVILRSARDFPLGENQQVIMAVAQKNAGLEIVERLSKIKTENNSFEYFCFC